MPDDPDPPKPAHDGEAVESVGSAGAVTEAEDTDVPNSASVAMTAIPMSGAPTSNDAAERVESESASVPLMPDPPIIAASESGSIDVATSAPKLPGESGSIDVATSAPKLPEVPRVPDPPIIAASESGSIDVATSAPKLASESGSIDIAMSGTRLPGESGSVEVTRSDSKLPGASGSVDVATSDPKSPRASGSIDVNVSAPKLPSEGAPVAAAGEPKPIPQTGRKRLTEGMKDAFGGGVSKLGTGIEHLGEGVSKVGDRTKKVPLVGAGVSMIGESISSVGESLHELPRVAKTRRGRLLVRSMVVAFVLVFAWIGVIVALQVRGTDVPDFRPDAHRILLELSKGTEAIEQAYEESSPRFQEMVRKERFVDDMTDLASTVGKYIEITAINDTLVTQGPTGRVGRVSLTVAFEKGKSKASVSLHFHEGKWKLLGIGVELPPEVTISQAQREERVAACKDPMDPKKCDVFVAANRILEQLRDGQAAQVWDAATGVFQKQEEKGRFMALQEINQRTLGDYRRIILVTEAKVIGGTNATFDIVTEYAKSNGVRAIFGFYRRLKADPWKLRSLKIVLPMPRADESGSGSGSGSGSAGSGSAGSADGPGPTPAGSGAGAGSARAASPPRPAAGSGAPSRKPPPKPKPPTMAPAPK